MKPTQQLHDLGQSLWIDNISRTMLADGTLKEFIDELCVTGLTSNPTIFEKAIGGSDAYDAAIRSKSAAGLQGEQLFYQLAIEDLTQAADLFLPVHQATRGIDGWVSLEVSPLLAEDTAGSLAAARQLHAQAARPNLFIKIPGTPAGIQAIEDSIFAGVPVNVTLLFSRAQYLAAAEAYLRGIERRIAAGLAPVVESVASVFVSRWDVAIKDKVTAALRNRLGIAISQQIYKACCELQASARYQKVLKAGAHPQRLLWASTGTKDPSAPDTLYVSALAAPDTVNTMPDKTLLAFADHGKVDAVMDKSGGDSKSVLAEFAAAGIDTTQLAVQLQREGAQSFTASWNDLLKSLASKS
ncbi:MAG TPA: transaldolase [Steroidobacteraceae bacterium]|nr:transaldolase [Steroidobacteraceae bacterium]